MNMINTPEYARQLDYGGTSAPKLEPQIEAQVQPPRERPVQKPMTREAARHKSKYSISLFAILSAAAIFILMIFLVLAHVAHVGVINGTVELNSQLAALEEQERRLEIEFISRVDMGELEQIARDVLGMSLPDIVLRNTPQDRAEVVETGDEESVLRGFGAFLSSLLEYFR